MENWTKGLNEAFDKNENPMYAVKLLFEKGFFNSVFKDIGLSNNYTENDLDLINNYFKSHRNLPLSHAECFSRASFGLYICKIAETNHKNVRWYIEDINKVKSDFEHGLVLEIKGKKDVKTHVFPIVRLGKIAFVKDDRDADLRHWYNVALKSGDFIYKMAKNV